MLSPETATRLQGLADTEKDYLPNAAVLRGLRDKSLVMMIGPSCIGKSTVMEEIVTQDMRFGITGSFTTRAPRPDDSKSYDYIASTDETLARLCKQIEAGEVVNYTAHPTTHDIYGTYLSEYGHPYNLLDTLATSAGYFRKLPFRNNSIVGVVADPDIWAMRLDQRFPLGNPARPKRIAEAVMSFGWLLDQSANDVNWVINEEGRCQEAAQMVIEVALGHSQGDLSGRTLAEQGLRLAKNLS